MNPPDGYGPDMAHFDWRSAAWSLRVPMIRALFEQVATPTSLGPLGLVEVLDWTTEALNRVDRPAFFASFEEGRAVQYFYEPFLEEFDPALRKDLGVWYTPDGDRPVYGRSGGRRFTRGIKDRRWPGSIPVSSFSILAAERGPTLLRQYAVSMRSLPKRAKAHWRLRT